MIQKQIPLSINGKLAVAGLVLAAVGIILQYFFRVAGLPTIPIISLVAAAMVMFGPWRWMLIVYTYDEEVDLLIIVTIQDARSSSAATSSR